MGLGNSANSELLSSHKQFPSSKKHLTLFSIPHALSSKSDSIYRADPKRHQPSIRAAVKQTRREAADAISRGEGGTSVGCLERHHFLSVGGTYCTITAIACSWEATIVHSSIDIRVIPPERQPEAQT